jgi:hypothetical protein
MIARMWRGWTRAETRRRTLSTWAGAAARRSSEDAIRAFAGDAISVAVFFPDDDRYLTDRELIVSHYEVVETRGLV